MATERELELLDNYLGNRLSGQEKSAFEKALGSDPSLKKEFGFQQQLIDGIRRERVLELKKSLNEIAVPASAGSSLAVKASMVVIAATIAASIYFGLRKNESEENTVVTSQKKQIAGDPSKEQPAIVQPAEPASKKEDKQQENKDAAKTAASREQKKTTETVTSPTQPKVDVYDPSQEPGESESTEKTGNAGVVAAETSSETVSSSSIIVETDNSNKKLNFHYQFKDGKLFLYGSFEKNLYEILEFFSNSKRTVFLFYNSNYYLLNEKQTKPAALKPITDPVLLNKLKEYREGN